MIEFNYIIENGVNENLENKPTSSSYFISKKNLKERKIEYLESARKSSGIYAHCAKVYLNQSSYNQKKIHEVLDKVNNREDTSDFEMNAFLRVMYLDKNKNNIPKRLKERIKAAMLNFKYWFTESGPDEMIFWTENHMILFHTAELLAGQLFPDLIFPNSGWNGSQHIEHALPLINRWLDWRAKFGFAEWHSNIYYLLDLIALLNLVDFAKNATIRKKAEMLIDLIGFDFANNFYKGLYATAHGRTSDELQLGLSITHPSHRELIGEPVWVMLGMGNHEKNSGNNGAAVFFATSQYNTPKILEDIAKTNTTAKEYIHKSRNNIDISQDPEYGFGYYNESDLMFWWPMSGPAAPPLLKPSLNLISKYNLAPKLVYNDEAFVYLFKIGAFLHRKPINEYSELISNISRGVALETANTYTYKTPYYQLSGVQDHQKGMMGLQELIWQACLDKNATVYTSSPSTLSTKKQQFTSGWKPRATFYKNVGIIQYDRQIQTFELELILELLGEPPYTHAYFPRWAFNEWDRIGNWVFGRRNDGFIGLYSYNPIEWKSSYELRAEGKKNVWIIELGSIADSEFDSYENFITKLINAKIQISVNSMGCEILYISPSQGRMKINWEGALMIDDQESDLGGYERFNNPYCDQKFGTMKTEITFNGKSLILDFKNVNKMIK